jgi:transcriptional regulator with XRE-family HTH domain
MTTDLRAAIEADWRLKLKPLRETLGMGLSATARRAGISKAYLWKVERAEAEPSVRVARQLAEALRVPLAALLDAAPPAPLDPHLSALAKLIADDWNGRTIDIAAIVDRIRASDNRTGIIIADRNRAIATLTQELFNEGLARAYAEASDG